MISRTASPLRLFTKGISSKLGRLSFSKINFSMEVEAPGAPQDDLCSLSKDELIQLVRQLREKPKTPDAQPKPTEVWKKKKPPREFDMARYSQRYVALKIAYIGANYKGLAAQENTDDTIEAVLFKALTKARLITSRETSSYTRSGRTDKGVSAFGQVIGLKLRSNMKSGLGVVAPPDASAALQAPEAASVSSAAAPAAVDGDGLEDGSTLSAAKPFAMPTVVPPDVPVKPGGSELPYVTAINALLPPDIRVLAWAPVPPEFNARFSTRRRVYKYFFLGESLDIERMRDGARRLIGEHDFRNLCRIDVVSVNNFVRRLSRFDIEPVAALTSADPSRQLYQMVIAGTAFLWHQVRAMAAILFLIGQRLEEPSVVDELLDIAKHAGKPRFVMQ
eukprot:TRINITY_DN4313_c0_g1_i2.p1 TRINITY_DN4313_c0_g1~~TRINITY_DN4313_c0_g1_i2.p1  ORF type:complete len:391 (-),score=54.05 TRINITY_DN4313_c0_g1_i2:72-1244(-)